MASISNWATCAICTESYDFIHRVPKSLDCRHTFCAPCITQACQTRRECPNCRAPVGNLRDLPKDLTMIDYMEQRSQADYAGTQTILRQRLVNVEKELTDAAEVLEKKAAEYRTNDDDITDKQWRLFKLRLGQGVAKIISSMEKKHAMAQILNSVIQDVDNQVALCDKPLAFTRSCLDQKHLLEEAVAGCEDKRHLMRGMNKSTIDDDVMYQAGVAEFIKEMQSHFSGHTGFKVDAKRSALSDRARVRCAARDYTTITKPKAMFGKKGDQPGEFDKPTGVTILPNGNILVTEYEGHRAQILTQQGEPVLQFGSKGKAEGQLDHPRRAAITADGKIAICDQGNHRIQFFTMTGQYSHTYGSEWKHLDEFDNPWDIAIDNRGNVYVAEGDKAVTQHYRVQVFNKTFTTSRQFGEEYLKKPVGIAVHGDHFVVCDSVTNQCELFQTDCRHVRSLCTSGSGPGQLKEPSAVAFDQHGNVFISDWGNDRIQIMKLTSEVIHVINKWGSNKYFSPWGIAVTDVGDLIVCDNSKDCIYIF